jgi:hypothetical protein
MTFFESRVSWKKLSATVAAISHSLAQSATATRWNLMREHFKPTDRKRRLAKKQPFVTNPR